MSADAKDCPTSFKNTIEKYNTKSRWTVKNNTVTITTTDNSLPFAIYTISYTNDTMTWEFTYADNLKTPNPTHAKTTTIIYKKFK